MRDWRGLGLAAASLGANEMTNTDLTNPVEIAFRRCDDLRERDNGDGTFTIDGAKMMALIELRNLAPEVVLGLSHKEQ